MPSKEGTFFALGIGVLRTVAQTVFFAVDILDPGPLHVLFAEVEMFGRIRRRGNMNVVVAGLEDPKAADHVPRRGSSAAFPLTRPDFFAFHVMVWSASNNRE